MDDAAPPAGEAPALAEVPNALLQPCSGVRGDGGWQIDGGVYDGGGALVPLAGHTGERTEEVAPPLLRRDDLVPTPGRWLFGGWLQPHFGHYLTYGLGRLWPLCRPAGGIEGVAFLALPTGRRQDDPLAYSPAIRDILACLGLGTRLPVRVVAEPTRFEHLAVPAPLLLGAPGAPPGHDAAFLGLLRAMRRSPLVHDGLALPGVYVSRRRLRRKGGILFEKRLEENLAAEGYAILYPERLSVPGQLAVYAAARRLIFAEGSALHLAVGCMEKGDRVAVIARRRPVTEPVRRYLDASGARTTVVQALRGAVTFAEGGRLVPKSTFLGLALLDLAAVRDQLVAAGFCHGRGWSIPTEAEVAARIAAAIAAREREWPDRRFGYVPVEEYGVGMSPAWAKAGEAAPAISGPG